jgi:hypothetical protein
MRAGASCRSRSGTTQQQTLDRINQRYGRSTLHLAYRGTTKSANTTGQYRAWEMKK